MKPQTFSMGQQDWRMSAAIPVISNHEYAIEMVLLGQSLSASSYTLNCNVTDCQLQALLCSMYEGFFNSFSKWLFKQLLNKSYIFNHIVFMALRQKMTYLKRKKKFCFFESVTLRYLCVSLLLCYLATMS